MEHFSVGPKAANEVQDTDGVGATRLCRASPECCLTLYGLGAMHCSIPVHWGSPEN